jgi:hypothetical protein
LIFLFDLSLTSPVASRSIACLSVFTPSQVVSGPIAEDVIKLFAEAQGEHQRKYGSKKEHFDAICYKNHKHSVCRRAICLVLTNLFFSHAFPHNRLGLVIRFFFFFFFFL